MPLLWLNMGNLIVQNLKILIIQNLKIVIVQNLKILDHSALLCSISDAGCECVSKSLKCGEKNYGHAAHY